MVLFGSAFTGSKVVVGEVPHDVAAMLRFGGAAVILVLLLCVSRDGSRFLVAEPLSEDLALPVTIVTDWTRKVTRK